ncbi:MAG: ATP-dependent zinc metalloprotease FtsH [Chloroflexi bacterium]|nr:ATP-dependent zinc metalloprotease FtsH [Chloroflexota bacterium]
MIAALVYIYLPKSTKTVNLTINQVAEGIQNGSISQVTIDGNTLNISFKNGSQGIATKEANSSLIDQLTALGVTPAQLSPTKVSLEIASPNLLLGFLSSFGYIIAVVLIGGVIFLIFRSARRGSNSVTSFGKSTARIVNSEQPNVTFNDVAGLEEAREELKEVVEFLREPQKFIALGARTPKGVLLVGAPGTGKTLLAKAVAGEAGVPFFAISGSEFVEMFVGVGASRVRDLFEQAKKQSPCIIFIDEIDAVGRQRGIGLGGGNDEREQTLNQMLVEMDGFSTDTNVIVIAATNRPDVLDPALLRPGRFDRRVVLDQPDMRGREAILKVHTRGKPIDPAVDLSKLALSIPGFVGADIENLVNEAAILAARRSKKVISQAELEESIERVIAGPERKSHLISQREKLVIAYHEAGHAVVMHALAKADPVFKITIVARGLSVGYTMPRPTEDRTLESRKRLNSEMVSLLGGRTAEELVFNDITTGASNDIERVTQIARLMVTQLGMTEAMGMMTYGRRQEMVFLSRQMSNQRDYSDTIAEQIDAQVYRLVDDAHEMARKILTQYRVQLDAVANRLLEMETLTQGEFESIFPSPVAKESGTPAMV